LERAVDLAGKQGVSADGKVWHLRPVALISSMSGLGRCICTKCGRNISLFQEFMRKVVYSSVTDEFVQKFVTAAEAMFPKYGVNSCSQVVYLLGQAKVETMGFTRFKESLNYTRRSYTPESLYAMAPTAINAGFARLGMTSLSLVEKINYIDNHLIANDSGYGRHCFGSNIYPNNDYRGRGLLHLTFFETYRRCAMAIGAKIDEHPEMLESDVDLIMESGLWFWKKNFIGAIAEIEGQTLEDKVKAVTYPINSGYKALPERKQSTRDIKAIFRDIYGPCAE
jgi:predicted chitinase